MNYKIRNIIEETWDSFHAKYKRHEIIITREKNFLFYIQVVAPSETYSYDGYYDSNTGSMDEAIEEALKGALLIK